MSANKIFFIILCVFFGISSNVNAFVYNQKLLPYKGGVISELNNCGATYTDNGSYLLGQRNLTAKLTSNQKDSVYFGAVAGGVVTVFKNGEVYFSPDGRYLDGGGASSKILDLTTQYSTGWTHPNSRKFGNYKNSFGVVGNSFVLIQTRMDDQYSIGQPIGQKKTCTRPGMCTITNIYASGYQHDITVVDLPSRAFKKFSLGFTNRIQNYLGSAVGRMYVQFDNGDIGKFDSVALFEREDGINILHKSAKILKGVVPYRHGLLAYDRNSAYWSSNFNEVLSGSGVKQIYSGAKNISSIVNYGGNAASESSLVQGATAGLIAAFEDGYTYFSPDGNSLSGGGNTREIIRPFDTNLLKQRFFAYFTSLKSQGIVWESPVYPGEFLSVATGHKITLKNMSVRLINKGGSEDYAKNPILLEGSGNSYITSMVSDFGGNFVNVKVSDKGWDGVEYKWRDRGERFGVFSHEVDGAFIGRPEIRITAKNSCVIAATFEDTNFSGGGVGTTWNLNADFTLANNSGGQSAMNDFFAAGGQNYPWSTDLLTRELGRLPSNFTFMQLVTWSIYHVNNILYDAAGYPMKGIDISYMDMD